MLDKLNELGARGQGAVPLETVSIVSFPQNNCCEQMLLSLQINKI